MKDLRVANAKAVNGPLGGNMSSAGMKEAGGGAKASEKNWVILTLVFACHCPLPGTCQRNTQVDSRLVRGRPQPALASVLPV